MQKDISVKEIRISSVDLVLEYWSPAEDKELTQYGKYGESRERISKFIRSEK